MNVVVWSIGVDFGFLRKHFISTRVVVASKSEGSVKAATESILYGLCCRRFAAWRRQSSVRYK